MRKCLIIMILWVLVEQLKISTPAPIIIKSVNQDLPRYSEKIERDSQLTHQTFNSDAEDDMSYTNITFAESDSSEEDSVRVLTKRIQMEFEDRRYRLRINTLYLFGAILLLAGFDLLFLEVFIREQRLHRNIGNGKLPLATIMLATVVFVMNCILILVFLKTIEIYYEESGNELREAEKIFC